MQISTLPTCQREIDPGSCAHTATYCLRKNSFFYDFPRIYKVSQRFGGNFFIFDWLVSVLLYILRRNRFYPLYFHRALSVTRDDSEGVGT